MAFIKEDCDNCGVPQISRTSCEHPGCGKAYCDSCISVTMIECKECGDVVCLEHLEERICITCRKVGIKRRRLHLKTVRNSAEETLAEKERQYKNDINKIAETIDKCNEKIADCDSDLEQL